MTTQNDYIQFLRHELLRVSTALAQNENGLRGDGVDLDYLTERRIEDRRRGPICRLVLPCSPNQSGPKIAKLIISTALINKFVICGDYRLRPACMPCSYLSESPWFVFLAISGAR